MQPDNYDIYLSRASLKKRFKKDYRGALEDYDLFEKYSPFETIPLILNADIRAEMKDCDGAIGEIKTGFKKFPFNIDLNFHLAAFLVDKDETDQAIDHLRSFLNEYSGKRCGKLPKIGGVKVKKKIPREFNDDDSAINAIPVARYT